MEQEPNDPGIMKPAILENDVLNIFVDISSLFRREPEVNPLASGEEPSSEAYLFSYLRMLERAEKACRHSS